MGLLSTASPGEVEHVASFNPCNSNVCTFPLENRPGVMYGSFGTIGCHTELVDHQERPKKSDPFGGDS